MGCYGCFDFWFFAYPYKIFTVASGVLAWRLSLSDSIILRTWYAIFSYWFYYFKGGDNLEKN